MGCVSMFLFLFFLGFARANGDDVTGSANLHNNLPDNCPTEPEGRMSWIIKQRRADYGWGAHTHRAIIALAVNYYEPENEAEWTRMDLQLEKEITKALLRKNKEPIHDNDLALYIHALIARNKNPRNFYGEDLVADIEDRVQRTYGQVHPFLILALCNAHAVNYVHLTRLLPLTDHHDDESPHRIAMKALALKALACAADLNPDLDVFGVNKTHAVECLDSKRISLDGSFGNAYTTALAVQALTAYDGGRNWYEKDAKDFLEKEAFIDVNMIKAYYIEMALNARKVKFIKDLNDGNFTKPSGPSKEPTHYVVYSVKPDERPDKYATITMKVSNNSNFYEIMEKSREYSNFFSFESYSNSDGEPVIYSVAGIPNDAEEDRFWRLCLQKRVDGLPHTSKMEEFFRSPKSLMPLEKWHIIFWYRNSGCPETGLVPKNFPPI